MNSRGSCQPTCSAIELMASDCGVNMLDPTKTVMICDGTKVCVTNSKPACASNHDSMRKTMNAPANIPKAICGWTSATAVSQTNMPTNEAIDPNSAKR